ncbi:hypothetical protein PGT21_009025 [Puccinia graminis f. sp. tritici]|uniref:Uncharacterized protein n=1 Tax=Puccinia graminis f. sp. tritici TaxID=56615 RepID=A0A5B0N6T0_PUCGR|nr:hypothetical protein PGT21_009025 [Puccinia graminis f. sp. tritici]
MHLALRAPGPPPSSTSARPSNFFQSFKSDCPSKSSFEPIPKPPQNPLSDQ